MIHSVPVIDFVGVIEINSLEIGSIEMNAQPIPAVRFLLKQNKPYLILASGHLAEEIYAYCVAALEKGIKEIDVKIACVLIMDIKGSLHAAVSSIGWYYWQVRAINAGGNTLANTGTYWSFTTVVAAPAAFNKTSPANAATSVATNPTLSWGTSTGATSYEYCYAITSGCTGWTSVGTNTSAALSGLSNNQIYYWQVRAINAGGNTLANTGTYWSFTTVVAPPAAFNKTSPTNGATGQSANPTLQWGTSTGATSYEYCYAITTGCTNWTSVGTNTSVALSGLSNNQISYWQVRAVNAGGNMLANTGTYWSFTTVVAGPAAFNKTSPVNAATGVATNPTLSWGTSTGATSYEYCYAVTTGCTGWTSAGTNTSAALSGLSNNQIYYWQVRAINAGGNTLANTGSYWSFTTVVSGPAAFNKTSPANAATSVATNPTLSWGTSTGATSYEYCYATTTGCTGWTSAGTSTSAALSGLSNNQIYYWQVRAVNAGGNTLANAGTYWSFTTVVTPPTCYTLILSHSGQGTNPVASPANSTGCSTGQYIAGATINLSSAVPTSGWQINSWTGTNNNSSMASTNTANMPASAHAVSVVYVDNIDPILVSILRASANPTTATSVDFTVTFSESITGVDTVVPFSDFSLTTSSGISGASIAGVIGSGATYTITVNTGNGSGTIRLDVPNTATITDLVGNPLSELPFITGETYTVNKNVEVYIGGALKGSYFLPPNGSTRQNYAGVDSGPVKVISTNGLPIISTIRSAWAVNGVTTSFSQLMGLPLEQLSDTYVFPGYNNVTLNDQLRIANVDTVATSVTVTIGGTLRGTYPLAAGAAVRINYPGLDSGPVIVKGTSGVKIISSIREAWAINGVTKSFVQLMGLPAGQLSNKYVFPGYNSVTLNEQLRIGNVDTVATSVTVTIGGTLRGTYPLGPGQAVRINYPGLDSGPVVVQGTAGVNIISSIRSAWAVNGVTTSFSQLMGMPAGQLSDQYLFPGYNNVTLNDQLRIANVDTVPTTVTVTIGGDLKGTYPLAAGGAVRINYAGLDSGPVVVQGTSGVKIISSIREAWAVNGVTQSFVQLMGLPAGQLSTTYFFPGYNNITLNEQLRIGMP